MWGTRADEDKSLGERKRDRKRERDRDLPNVLRLVPQFLN